MLLQTSCFVDIVIVGTGHAGGVAALTLRELGFSGSLMMVGAESHLPHHRPAFSKEALQLPGWKLVPLAPLEEFKDQDVTLLHSDPVVNGNANDHTLILASGRHLKYGKLVIATGAAPRRILGPFNPHPARHVLRTFEDAVAIRHAINRESKVVVIGGGPIGLETAASLRAQVAEVSVVEAAPRLMARSAPPDISAALMTLHEANGVRIMLSSPVASLLSKGKQICIELISGESLLADVVIEGLGVEPETRLAVILGLPISNGIVVNEFYQTHNPAVYAIGDCACPPTGRQETWSHAEASGRTVARALLGKPPEPTSQAYFWTDQYGSRAQVAGDITSAVDSGSRGAARLYARDGRITAAAAIDAPRDFAAARRLIGQLV